MKPFWDSNDELDKCLYMWVYKNKDDNFTSSYKDQIDFTNSSEIVSSDFVGNRYAGIIDSAATICHGDHVILYVWYDYEFGYTVQLLGLVKEMVGLTYKRYPEYQESP